RQFQQLLVIIGGRRGRHDPRNYAVPVFDSNFVSLPHLAQVMRKIVLQFSDVNDLHLLFAPFDLAIIAILSGAGNRFHLAVLRMPSACPTLDINWCETRSKPAESNPRPTVTGTTIANTSHAPRRKSIWS